MKVGDLVKNLNSESKMTGIIVGWHGPAGWEPREDLRAPVVLWADGRCGWILRHQLALSA